MKKMDNKKAPEGREVNGIHTTSIRVAERLINRIKQRADDTGASVNSTICHLLDLGLSIQDRDITIHRPK